MDVEKDENIIFKVVEERERERETEIFQEKRGKTKTFKNMHRATGLTGN